MSLFSWVAETWENNRVKTIAASAIWLLTTYPIAGPIIAGANPIKFVASAPLDPSAAISYYLAQSAHSAASPHGAICLISYAAVSFLVMFSISAAKSSKTKREVSGSGDVWDACSEKNQAKIEKACPTWTPGKPGRPGFVVGYRKGRYLVSPCTHLLTCAFTGSGKSRRLISAAAANVASGGGNLVITDPSGELHCHLAPFFGRCGMEVLYIDLVNPFRGARVNLLAPLLALDTEGLSYLASDKAAEIGAAFFPSTGGKEDSFTQPCAGLFAAICYVVATDANIPQNEKNLWSVTKTLLSGTLENEGTALKRYLLARGTDDPATTLAATFLTAEKEYLSSILGTLHNGLRPFVTEGMRYLLSGDDVNIPSLTSRRAALIVRTAKPGAPANKVASLLIDMVYAQLEKSGERRGTSRETYFLIDEMHSIPRFSAVLISEQGRKYGAHLGIYVQGLNGLDQYSTPIEDGKRSIIANCTGKLMVSCGDKDDAKWWSELSGERLSKFRNEGTNKQFGLFGNGSASEGYSESRVPVWAVNDVMRRDPEKDGMLLWQKTGNPSESGLFEPKLGPDPSATTLASLLGTFGSRGFEARLFKKHADELDRKAAKARRENLVPAWTPDLSTSTNDNGKGRMEAADDVFGL